jgi:ADP-heptose:LPS heptosyltransferase
MHILLNRFSSMGDVVLTTAVINWLHSFFGKDLVVTFVTSEEFADIMKEHPGVNHVVSFGRRKGEKWKDLIRKIDVIDEDRPIDLIIDLHATLRSFRLRCSFWNIPALTVDKRRWERFFLTKLRSTKLKKIFDSKIFGLEPQVIRTLKDFEHLFQDKASVFRTRKYRAGNHDELTSLHSLPRPMEGDYIVVAPSASFLYKRWPVESFVNLTQELLAKTKFDIVILAGPDDKFCEAFEKIDSPRLYNLQGKTSLSESMAYLEYSKLCIGNDSGMNHIAEAYGVPVVTLFGPTDPRFGFAPHGSKSITLSKELWCKPCSTTGKKDCFRDQHYCMQMITVKEVESAALKILETT